ncbi:BLUF domain-containing protein [Desulfoluna sp.]|uniref:BLUF domain-containing protein n=1 Tax=Desulfoluna sp. TaxID=2045199 RepID=UPI0026276431|nr:BLUF domain-containing protein [Desulfoluna sp.]
MNMVRLIYASRLAPHAGPRDVQIILETARANNPAKGITGALCYNDTYFLQCIEGPRTAINQLYTSILSDERAADSTLMEYSDIHERIFENWSMAYVKADELTEQIVMKYGADRHFNPYEMNGEQALGFMINLAREKDRYLATVIKK